MHLIRSASKPVVLITNNKAINHKIKAINYDEQQGDSIKEAFTLKLKIVLGFATYIFFYQYCFDYGYSLS